ncbi:hypothetical protein [Pseudorhodoferax sp. Leaf265]|uniref:hypothetical protein n=1 Tax=Pseudorhodoferax sp. Leaf265 TaxID=1736315 RepID=UPI0006F2A710|nr:hypothetical protein [Pseudorhodoferax sp. Leaf265]KQP17031.1 hypothetical protein ASF45_27830 [Pseudorhodoferax sp. Leaf265]
MTDYNSLSAAAFTDLLIEKLDQYKPKAGVHSSFMFYFDGQDPFAFSQPSRAIHSLHASLSEAAKRNFEEALLNVIGARNHAFSTDVVQQLAMAVGNLRKLRLVSPLMSRIKARAARTHAPRDLFVIAIMVLKGFGAQKSVFEATKDLMGMRGFPNDLVIDGLEILVAGDGDFWDERFIQWRSALELDYAADHARVKQRLRHAADWYVKNLSIDALKDGFDRLRLRDHESLHRKPLQRRTDVTAAFVWALLQAEPRLQELIPSPTIEEAEFGLCAFLEAAE